MRVFIPRFLGAITYLVVLMMVGTICYVVDRGVAVAGRPLHDRDHHDRGGFPRSPTAVRAWPGPYDGSSGGRYHGDRRLVRADHLMR